MEKKMSPLAEARLVSVSPVSFRLAEVLRFVSAAHRNHLVLFATSANVPITLRRADLMISLTLPCFKGFVTFWHTDFETEN
jgi:hypothetical protein